MSCGVPVVAKLSGQQIRELAKEIVQASPGGIRYADLVRRIAEEHPETPRNTIHGAIWNLQTYYPDLIQKPSRGLFVWVGDAGRPPQAVGEVKLPKEEKLPREEEFYAPLAQWLKHDLDEVSEAIPVGGAGFRRKWGTPDVVEVYKPLASHRIKFPPEIVSAEIKVDPGQPVEAFGQAVAYRLFSSMSYVVMPARADLWRTKRLLSVWNPRRPRAETAERRSAKKGGKTGNVSPVLHQLDL